MFDDTEIVEQTPEVEVVQEQPVEQPQQEIKKVEFSEERNLRALREKAERIERERDDAYRLLQQLQNQQQKPQQPEESDDFTINADDVAEGKHLHKVDRKIRKLEEQMKNYYHQSSEIAIEAQLKAQYPDLDKVLSKDNLEQLRSADPELANIINNSNDLYNKAASAYKAIKRLGIYQEDIYKQEKELAQKNAVKPKPLTSISPQQGDSPMSRANAFANGLTEDLKKQLYKEMMELRKNS